MFLYLIGEWDLYEGMVVPLWWVPKYYRTATNFFGPLRPIIVLMYEFYLPIVRGQHHLHKVALIFFS